MFTFRGLTTYFLLPNGPLQTHGSLLIFLFLHSGSLKRHNIRSNGMSDALVAERQSFMSAYMFPRVIHGASLYCFKSFGRLFGAGT